MTNIQRIDLLNREHCLNKEDWVALFATFTKEDSAYAQTLARKITHKHFGKTIYFRGIVEFSNICKNDCYYCGIRCSNHQISRYRLTPEDILSCCQEGYEAGLPMRGWCRSSVPSKKLIPIAR